MSFHSSRASLKRQYKFTQFGFVNPSIKPQTCTEQQWSIWFPKLQRDGGPVIQKQTEAWSAGPSQCYVASSWIAAYSNGFCPTQRITVFSGAPFAEPPLPTGEYPSYRGEVTRDLNGTVTYRTIAISNQTIKVYLLTRNTVYYYNSGTGLSMSPPFYDEWVTEDGRSVSDALMQQYYTLGLTLGSRARSSLSYMPATVYTIIGSPGECSNEACTRNKQNYRWIGPSSPVFYGEPTNTILIAPVSKPLPCDAVYDCNSVGSTAVAENKTPVPCNTLTQFACCNIDGYVCSVRFNYTAEFAQEIEKNVNISIISFQRLMKQLQEQNLTLADYSYILQLENTTKTVNDLLNREIPLSRARTTGLEIGLKALEAIVEAGKAVTDAAITAATAPFRIASMFSQGLGSFFETFLVIILYLVPILIFACIGYCIFTAFMNGDFSSFKYTKQPQDP